MVARALLALRPLWSVAIFLASSLKVGELRMPAKALLPWSAALKAL
jgi:hypothetical protein